MLEDNCRELFDRIASDLVWQIELPPKMAGFLEQRGYTTSNVFDKRRCARARIPCRAVMWFVRSLPAFPRSDGLVGIYTADLSRHGIGILCHEQLFPGEEVRILLPTSYLDVTIVRGRRAGPKCFEAGCSIGHASADESSQ